MNRDFTRYQPLPLTLALSRRERENCSPACAQAGAFSETSILSAGIAEVGDKTNLRRNTSDRRLLFPLPEGEGQGEGTTVRQVGSAQQPNSAHP